MIGGRLNPIETNLLAMPAQEQSIIVRPESIKSALSYLDEVRKRIQANHEQERLRTRYGLALNAEQWRLFYFFLIYLGDNPNVLSSRKRSLPANAWTEIFDSFTYHFTVVEKMSLKDHGIASEIMGNPTSKAAVFHILTLLDEELTRLKANGGVEVLREKLTERYDRPIDLDNWLSIIEFLMAFNQTYARNKRSGFIWLRDKLNKKNIVADIQIIVATVFNPKRSERKSTSLEEVKQRIEPFFAAQELTMVSGQELSEAEAYVRSVYPANYVEVGGSCTIDGQKIYVTLALGKQAQASLQSVTTKMLGSIGLKLKPIISQMVKEKRSTQCSMEPSGPNYRTTFYKFRKGRGARCNFLVTRRNEKKIFFIVVAIFLKKDQRKIHGALGIPDAS